MGKVGKMLEEIKTQERGLRGSADPDRENTGINNQSKTVSQSNTGEDNNICNSVSMDVISESSRKKKMEKCNGNGRKQSTSR